MYFSFGREGANFYQLAENTPLKILSDSPLPSSRKIEPQGKNAHIFDHFSGFKGIGFGSGGFPEPHDFPGLKRQKIPRYLRLLSFWFRDQIFLKPKN